MKEVESYLEANRELEAAKLEAASISYRLSQVTSLLNQSPERIWVAGTTIATPPDIAANSATHIVKADDWPTPEKINTAVARRYAAVRAARSAWEAVPSDLKPSLVGPKLHN